MKDDKKIYTYVLIFALGYFLIFAISLNIDYIKNKNSLLLENFKDGMIIPKNVNIYIGDNYYNDSSNDNIVNIAYCYDDSCKEENKFVYVDNIDKNSKYTPLAYKEVFSSDIDYFIGYRVESYYDLGIDFIFYPVFKYDVLNCLNSEIDKVNWYLYSDDIKVLADGKKLDSKNGIYNIPLNNDISFKYDTDKYDFIKFDIRNYDTSINTNIDNLNKLYLNNSYFNNFTSFESFELENNMYLKFNKSSNKSYVQIKDVLALKKYDENYVIHNGDYIYYEIICENGNINSGTMMYDYAFGPVDDGRNVNIKLDYNNYNISLIIVIDLLMTFSIIFMCFLIRKLRITNEK